MKRLILFTLILFSFVFIITSPEVESLCCDVGCFPDANRCCGPQGATVGVEGCYDSVNDQYLCPGEDYRLGECLSCGDNNEWVSDTEELQSCNSCLVEGNPPTGSTCDPRCGEGESACRIDGISSCCPAQVEEDCGDGICSLGESCSSCSQDCGSCTDLEYCGNSFCSLEDGEACGTCPNDCGTCNGNFCGDGICSLDEDCSSCSLDCNSCDDPEYCGDLACNSDEASSTCPNDCTEGVLKEEVCNFNNVCEDNESCSCDDCNAGEQAGCLPGLLCSEERLVCSGDSDGDGVLNDDDVCIDFPDPDQDDEDNDCYFDDNQNTRSPLFGYCGDACEGEFGLCESVYGDKQCCDSIPGSQGSGQFFGFTEDCPAVENAVGCWTGCFARDDNGNIIKYETGPCIDSKKTITELKCDPQGESCIPQNTFTESCFGIPLVPFFTWVNLLVTLIILVGYYSLTKKKEGYH